MHDLISYFYLNLYFISLFIYFYVIIESFHFYWSYFYLVMYNRLLNYYLFDLNVFMMILDLIILIINFNLDKILNVF